MPRIWVVEKMPGEPPHAVQIVEDLTTLKTMVGGYIELVRIPSLAPLLMYMNEYGRRLKLEPNLFCQEIRAAGDVILGRVVVTGPSPDGEIQNMTINQIEQAVHWLKAHAVVTVCE